MAGYHIYFDGEHLNPREYTYPVEAITLWITNTLEKSPLTLRALIARVEAGDSEIRIEHPTKPGHYFLLEAVP